MERGGGGSSDGSVGEMELLKWNGAEFLSLEKFLDCTLCSECKVGKHMDYELSKFSPFYFTAPCVCYGPGPMGPLSLRQPLQ